MIFGIGLGRTGTVTLTEMLIVLGLTASHDDSKSLPNWVLADFRVRGDCDALIESPFVRHFRLADELYPGSKFILTIRDKDQWVESFRRWMYEHQPEPGSLHFNRRILTLGTARFHRRLLEMLYDEHYASVAEYFAERPHDLLVIDVTATPADTCWQQLAQFIGRAPPPPSTPLPHLNRSKPCPNLGSP